LIQVSKSAIVQSFCQTKIGAVFAILITNAGRFLPLVVRHDSLHPFPAGARAAGTPPNPVPAITTRFMFPPLPIIGRYGL